MPGKVGGKGWGRHITPYERGKRRAPKYRNVKVEVDGVSFDSIKEAHRWEQLKLRLRAGEIRDLRLQTRHPLTVNGIVVAHYVADFDYLERHTVEGLCGPAVAWREVTEDVKGGEATQTDVFKLKAKIFEAIHGRKVRIT